MPTSFLLARFVIFGSFVTAKPDPNDIDIFMVMDDGFDVGSLERETAFLFDHPAAQSYFGASVFWIRRLAVLGGETAGDGVGFSYAWLVSAEGAANLTTLAFQKAAFGKRSWMFDEQDPQVI